MQTFLPYRCFKASAKALDSKRLGKQRVEAKTLINGGWPNHPASKMWKGYLGALKQYHDAMVEEWIRRGYNNTMQLYNIRGVVMKPHWLGDEAFHASHRSNLLRKDFEYYSQHGWTEPTDLPYIWPKLRISSDVSQDRKY